MADEAVIRIRLEDGGVSTTQSRQRPAAPQERQTPVLPAGKPASFDPYGEATKRREAEVRREQVKSAYADLYGDAKTGFDKILDMTERFRGLLGGTFGQVVGAALDAAAAFREIRAKAEADIPIATPSTLARSFESPLLSRPSVPKAVPATPAPSKPATAEPPSPAPPATPRQAKPIPPATPAPSKPATAEPPSPAPPRAAEPTLPPAKPGPVEMEFNQKTGSWEQTRAVGFPQSRAVGFPNRGIGKEVPTLEPYVGQPTGFTANRPVPPATAAPAEAAGAEAAAATAAEAAIPLIGAVVVAAELIKKKFIDLKNEMVSVVKNSTDVLVDIAKPGADIVGYADKTGAAFDALGEKIIALNPQAGILLSVTGAAIQSFGRLTVAVDQAADHYAKYNQQLAFAQAVGEMRQVYGDFRRAQLLAPELSKYSLAKSKLDQDVEDIKASMLNEFLPLLTQMVKAADATVVGTNNSLNLLGNVAEWSIGSVEWKSVTEAWKQYWAGQLPQMPEFADPTQAILTFDVQVPNA